MHEGYGPKVHYITFPWSNESPAHADAERAPVRPAPVAAVQDRRLQHADGADRQAGPGPGRALQDDARLHRRHRRMPLDGPALPPNQLPRTAKVADAIIINSESLR